MSIRKTPFVNNQYYHVFNRGVDKRQIFEEYEDLQRFFQSMDEFNTFEPIGSIFENSFRKNPLGSKASKLSKMQGKEKLVNFICYCINPNHYHFLLQQITNKGIEKFMHRLGTGYTKYFNHKYDRNGSLFQGKFKSVHISSNEYLLHLSAYINLNDKVHKLGSKASKWLTKSSWNEYLRGDKNDFCKKDIILGQFNSPKEYKNSAEESLAGILERKEMKQFLLE